jgi:thioredoxin 1
MATTALTMDTFEEAVLGDGITIVDFWAEWCGPCKMFAPVFEESSESHPGIRFAKVDTEAEQQLAAALQIRSIPTVMVFRDGVLLFNRPGAMAAHQLEQIIDTVEALDMDEVRREIAEQESNGSSGDPS